MLKKIALGTLFIGLIGILVTGAVIWTVDRTELVAEAQGRRRGNSETGAYATGSSGRGRGGYSQGREDAPGDQTGTGQAHVEEWLTLQGTVVSVDVDTLLMQTDSGEHVTMENRSWWFTQERGFSAQMGDQVTLVGFYEKGDFEVGQISDTTNGQTVLVRDENGRPLWAGRGRRGAAESANHCEKEEEKTNKTNFTNSTSFLHHFSIIVCYTESRRGGNPAMIWTSANHCEKEE